MTIESLYKHPRIKPGNYKAKWTSNYVRVILDDGTMTHKILVNVGVRGIGINCTAIVHDDGKIVINQNNGKA